MKIDIDTLLAWGAAYKKVAAGEICLFVFTSSAHRKAAIEACNETVERLKAELPIWGKELFADETYQWKEPSKSP